MLTAYKQILRAPLALLFVLLLVIGWAALHLDNFRFDASADTLVVKDDPLLLEYLEFARLFETDDFLVLTYTSEDIFSAASLAEIEKLQLEVSRLDGVRSTFSILDAPLLQSPPVPLDELSTGFNTLRDEATDRVLARQELTRSPLFSEYLVSVDGTSTAISIELVVDQALRDIYDRREKVADENRRERQALQEEYKERRQHFIRERARLVQGLREIRDHYQGDATLFISGVPMIAADMIDYIESDLVTFGGGVFALIVTMLFVFFREVRWVLLPLLTSAATLVVTSGIVASLDKPVTVISSNFIALLAIVTISLTVHLIVRYRELAATAGDHHQLVTDTMVSKFAPCFYTALTTVVAFGSLLASRIVPVEDFGWIMCLGVAVALAVTYTLFPSILLLLGPSRHPAGGRLRVTGFFQKLVTRFPRPTVLVAATLVLPCVAGIMQINYDNRFSDYFSPSSEIRLGMTHIDNHLGGTLPLDIYLRFNPFEPDAEEDDFFNEIEDDYPERYWFTPQKIQVIASLESAISERPEVGKTLSLGALEKTARAFNDERPLDAAQIAYVLGELPADIRDLLMRPYADPETGWMRINLRVRDTGPLFSKEQLIADIKSLAAKVEGLQTEEVVVTGVAALFEKMLKQLASSQRDTLIYVLIATFTMFALLLRSISLAALALMPNALAAAMMIAIMGFAGISMDMMTITIAAISIGIGVDNAIHYLHRYRFERERRSSVKESIVRAHDTIGRAMYFTAVTVVAGLSILTFSSFVPTVNFGILTACAMIFALFANMVILPALLLVTFGWKESAPEGRPESTP